MNNPTSEQTVKLGLSILQACISLEMRPTNFSLVVETKREINQ